MPRTGMWLPQALAQGHAKEDVVVTDCTMHGLHNELPRDQQGEGKDCKDLVLELHLSY